MSYRFEKSVTGTDLVMEGIEKGIADSPYLGISDMRNINIISQPNEGSVNFATSAMNTPPTVSAVSFTVDSTNDTFTVSSTTGYYNGMAIQFNTIVTATGFSTGRVYWIGNLSGNTFKIYKNPSRPVGQLVDVTLSGSGTLSSYTMGSPLSKTIAYSGAGLSYNYEFLLDNLGLVWWIDNTGGTPTSNIIYLGNTTLTGTTGRNITIFQGYLIVFRTNTTDYLNLSSIENNIDLKTIWDAGYNWQSVNSVNENPRPVLTGQDGAIYYGNSNRVGSILVNAGSVFDPATSSTYTKNSTALALGNNDQVTALGELGTNLLVGGMINYVYPWDRVSTSYKYPIILAENYTSKIVSANSSAYIFCGNRGRIYITNGTNIELWKKVPDSITSTIDPYFTWGDAVYWKNQLYFSFSASTNAGVSIDTVNGIWGIDLSTEALRYTNLLSTGVYTGTTPVLLQNVLSTSPSGAGLYAGWVNSGVYGIDTTSATPYTGGQAYITWDLIPTGTFLTKANATTLEFKLSAPLVAGESISLYWRSDLSQSFTLIKTINTVGLISDILTSNFYNVQWIQLKAVLTSTASTPSYVRLRELRLRLS